MSCTNDPNCSGNPGCPCCPTTVLTHCCQPIAFPTTLHALMQRALNGQVVEQILIALRWVPVNCEWEGGWVSSCINPPNVNPFIKVCFGCYGPFTSCNNFQLKMTCNNANCCNLVTFNGPNSCTCNPIFFLFQNGTMDVTTGCAGQCIQAWNVTVTV